MNPLHLETPLFESPALSKVSGHPIWLKLEAVQPPGSFKIRGIGHACQEYARRGARRFISSSGGNAGIAVAYTGRKLGVPVVVVVPETTSETAKAKILQERAEVIVRGATWDEANALASSMIGESDAFLHPFDDPLIWQGHSTMVDEIVRSGVRPAVIVLSVGGGGLLSGVAQGLHRHGWTDVPIVAVETSRRGLAGPVAESRTSHQTRSNYQHRHDPRRIAGLRAGLCMVEAASSAQRRGFGSGGRVRMPEVRRRPQDRRGARVRGVACGDL